MKKEELIRNAKLSEDQEFDLRQNIALHEHEGAILKTEDLHRIVRVMKGETSADQEIELIIQSLNK